jgi:hypothetical protein
VAELAREPVEHAFGSERFGAPVAS